MTMRYELGLWPLTRVSLRCGRLVWNARSRELLACTGWIVFIRSLISSTTRVGCSSSATFDRVHADLRAMLVSSNVRGCREEPGVLLLDYSNWILPRIDVTSLSFRPKMGREVVRFFLLTISLFSLSWILNIENRYWKYWLEIIEKIFLSLIKLPNSGLEKEEWKLKSWKLIFHQFSINTWIEKADDPNQISIRSNSNLGLDHTRSIHAQWYIARIACQKGYTHRCESFINRYRSNPIGPLILARYYPCWNENSFFLLFVVSYARGYLLVLVHLISTNCVIGFNVNTFTKYFDEIGTHLHIHLLVDFFQSSCRYSFCVVRMNWMEINIDNLSYYGFWNMIHRVEYFPRIKLFIETEPYLFDWSSLRICFAPLYFPETSEEQSCAIFVTYETRNCL